MANKNNNNYWIFGIIILAIILIYGGNQGWFKSIFNVYPTQEQTPQVPFPKEVITEYVTYTASLSLVPTSICSGELVTGTINSNIPNGICSIFIDSGTGYAFYSNVNLDYDGRYSQTTPVYPIGTATFLAVCCDASGNCKLSNTRALTVRTCDSDGDGIPDETDPDDDNDGYYDEVEVDEGTDPKDPFSHPGGTGLTCDSSCRFDGYSSGRGPVDSPGRCAYPEVYQDYSGTGCCCMPSNQPSYTCGQGSDTQCGGTCPSGYPYCLEVSIDSDTYSCMCADSNGETGNIHPDWKTSGSMYNTHEENIASSCTDSDSSSNFESTLLTQSSCTDSSGTHADSCVDGDLEEWYCTMDNTCARTQYPCASWFGDNAYCRSGRCFVDPYVNPSNCASTCSSFEWSYQIDNAEHCLDANVNLCYYSGQMTGIHSYHEENNCCCFTCG